MESYKPPYSNRGVLHTEVKPLHAVVDWLQVTFLNCQNDDVLTEENIIKNMPEMPDFHLEDLTAYLSQEDREMLTDRAMIVARERSELVITNRLRLRLESVLANFNLDLNDFVLSKKTKLGYKFMMEFGQIQILYGGEGIHVHMSGQACRQYEHLPLKVPWDKLFKILLDLRDESGDENRLGNRLVNFPRLDVAIDERRFKNETPYFSIRKLILRAKKGCCRSKFITARQMEQFVLDTGGSEGYTLYLGSKKSEVSIRFYDKFHERLNKGGEEYEHLKDLTSWNRMEIQLRNDRALGMAELIANNGNIGSQTLGVLKEYVTFVEKSTKDSNKSRWLTSRWWDDYLDGIEPLSLTMESPETSIDQTALWHKNCTSKALAKIVLAKDYDYNEFSDQVAFGISKLSNSDWNEIKAYRQKKEIIQEDDQE